MSPRAPHRFYHPGHLADADAGALVELSTEESRHILRVLRLRPGDPVELFDAAGLAWSAELADTPRGVAAVRLLGSLDQEPDSAPAIHIAVAVIKRNPMDWMIEKLSELGVQTVQPLLTARSIGQGDIKPYSEPPERWERLAIAAAKQCGRNRPMLMQAPAPLGDWLSRPRPPARNFITHPALGAPPLGQALLEAAPGAPPAAGFSEGLPIWIAIGPEGGWTDQELEDFAAAGFSPVRLGRWILRTETAALAAAAVCQGVQGAGPKEKAKS